MKSTKMLTILVLALGLIVWTVQVGQAAPMGTGWTYQGRLMDANSAADGVYDFEFKLFDANTAGSQQGSTINEDDVDVIDGYFTVELGFGAGVFDGDAVWLETSVRPGDSNDVNDFVTLSPRQEVTPTPYALYAASGPGVPVPLELSGSFDYPGSVLKVINTGSGIGVYGKGSNGTGVLGYTGSGYGVYGKHSSGNYGLLGGNNYGVYGSSSSGYGVYGDNISGYAGYFNGRVRIREYLELESMQYGDYKNVQWDSLTKIIGYDNSSKRFKENIKPINDDFSKILGVTPKTYTRPGNPGRWEVGYIAEEFVEAGLEKLVWFEDEEHTIPDGINYEKIILYTNEIVKANRQTIQELKAKVAKQQAENKALIAAQQKQIEYLQKIEDLQKEVVQLKNLMKKQIEWK